jgi:hypothetical protein
LYSAILADEELRLGRRFLALKTITTQCKDCFYAEPLSVDGTSTALKGVPVMKSKKGSRETAASFFKFCVTGNMD